jgi:hypothetical protein
MEPLAVTLTKARETKNTVRYEELVTDQPVVIGTLYAHKWAVKRLDDPETPRSPSRQPEAAESRPAQIGRRSLRAERLQRAALTLGAPRPTSPMIPSQHVVQTLCKHAGSAVAFGPLRGLPLGREPELPIGPATARSVPRRRRGQTFEAERVRDSLMRPGVHCGQRDSEVVQRTKGLWLHRASRWRQGRLRARQLIGRRRGHAV